MHYRLPVTNPGTTPSAPRPHRPLGVIVATHLFEIVEPLPRPWPLGFRQLDVRHVDARIVVRKHRGRRTGVRVQLM